MAGRAGRSWGTGLAGALFVHAAVVLAVVLTVKIASPPKEPPAFLVRLVQAWRPPPKPSPEPSPRGRSRPSAGPAAAALSASAASPATAPAPPPAAAGPQGADDLAKVRSILRGSAACSDMDRFHLSREERDRCTRMLQAHLDPNLQIPAPMDPAKRAWFDASVRAHQLAQRMPAGPPGLGNAAVRVAGIGGAPGTTAGHEVKVGPLSIGLPPGAFNDDDAPPPQH